MEDSLNKSFLSLNTSLDLERNVNNDEMNKKLHEIFLVNCRSVGDFEKMEELGEGTYGKVCKNNSLKLI